MPFDSQLNWLHDLIVETGVAVDLEVERADDIFAAGIIIDQIKERIATADVVIGVCTGRNANVFYELGIAERYHMPILVAAGLDDLPFDVQHYRALLYGLDLPGQDKSTLGERLSKAIVETIQVRADRLTEYLAREPVAQVIERTTAPEPELHVELEAQLYNAGDMHFLEVRNSGDVRLSNVEWEIPNDAKWEELDIGVPHPLPELIPGEHIRVPIAIAFGSQVATTIALRGEEANGRRYSRNQLVTIYG